VKDPLNETRRKLAVAVSQSNDTTGFYSSFFSPKANESDIDVISAAGFLSYDVAGNIYKVSSSEKITNPDEPGNMITLDNNRCIVTGEGIINAGVDLGQVKLNTAGVVVNNLNNDSTEFDVLMGIDFMFNEEALKSIVEVIQNYPTLQPTKDARPVWVRGMKSFLGKDAAEKLTTEYNLYGAPRKVPEPLQKSLFLTDLKLHWDMQAQAYRSAGPIGLGFVGKEAVSRLLSGYVEIVRKKGNDVISIYLEADKNNWWYFNYSRGIMQAISSDSKFNDAIQNTKPEKRIAEAKDKQAAYEYMLSTDRKRAEFVKRMQAVNQ
jgi:hypothetical protein